MGEFWLTIYIFKKKVSICWKTRHQSLIRNAAVVLCKLYLRQPCLDILAYYSICFSHFPTFIFLYPNPVVWAGLGFIFFPPNLGPCTSNPLANVHPSTVSIPGSLVAPRWIANTNYFSLPHPSVLYSPYPFLSCLLACSVSAVSCWNEKAQVF